MNKATQASSLKIIVVVCWADGETDPGKVREVDIIRQRFRFSGKCKCCDGDKIVL